MKTIRLSGGPESVHSSSRAWVVLALGVVAYDLKCQPGETLSEGVDRYLERKPLLTKAIIGTTALHLLNVLPERIDPFTQALKAAKRY